MAEYTPTGTYHDNPVSEADKKKLDSLSAQWHSATAAGDTASADAAHAEAERIRAGYGYSGGADGSEYHAVSTEKQAQGQQPSYTAPTLTPAQSQAQYIEDIYAEQQKATEAALKAAYDQNVLTLDATAQKIPGAYQAARNEAASQSEIARQSFNEYAAASGLGNGAAAQMHLSMNTALGGNLNALSTAEANAKADLELQRAQIETKYKNDIAQAIADGNFAKAQALYNEAIRVDESIRNTQMQQATLDQNAHSINQNAYLNNYAAMEAKAATLAQYGDFSGYAALGYTPEQIAAMQAEWQRQNTVTYSGGGGGGSDTAGDDNALYVTPTSVGGSEYSSTPRTIDEISANLGYLVENGMMTDAEAKWIIQNAKQV